MMRERYGIDPDTTRGVQTAIYFRSYLNDAQYDRIISERAEAKRKFMDENGDALLQLLWPKDTGSIVAENSRLKARCAAYEEYITTRRNP